MRENNSVNCELKYKNVYKEYGIEELTKLRKAQLELLLCFSKLCEKNDLNWFICFGSLLGAARHGGYIPWDDDLDVGMLREDYDVFLEVAHRELPSGFKLLSAKYEGCYLRAYSRLTLSGTKNTYESMSGEDADEGICIDIFVFDNVPSDKDKAIKFIKKSRYWHTLCKRITVENPETYLSKLSEELRNKSIPKWNRDRKIANRLGITAKQINYFFEKKRQKYKNKATGLVASIKGNGDHVYSYDSLKNTIDMFFEGIRVRVPADWIGFLKADYDDYTYIPEDDDRKNHNSVCLEFGEWNEKLGAFWDIDEGELHLVRSQTEDAVKKIKAAKENGDKVILLRYTMRGFCQNFNRNISKLKDALDVLVKKPGVTVVLCPHARFTKNMSEVFPEYVERYTSVIDSYSHSSNVIFTIADELRCPDEARLLLENIDAYYGDYTEMMQAAINNGIPVLMTELELYI